MVLNNFFSHTNEIKINTINNKYNLLYEIEIAKNEWELALSRFNEVSDPDVVDYFIYYIIASERKYMYLLNKYKTNR